MAGFISFGSSDLGLRRANNEDSFMVKPELGFAALADGMGGPPSGEVASRIFIDTAFSVFSEKHLSLEEEVSEAIKRVFQMSNKVIFRTSASNMQHRGMGCTGEVLAFYQKRYVLGHVGDSRTYLLRSEKLRQLTRDHSAVQDWVDLEIMTKEEARHHPSRNALTRAVGTQEKVTSDIVKGSTQPGDIFLLCSDGLTDMVEDESIREALLHSSDLEHTAGRLIELARSAGGSDNTTVVLCKAK
jgi:protein phosphatase